MTRVKRGQKGGLRFGRESRATAKGSTTCLGKTPRRLMLAFECPRGPRTLQIVGKRNEC